MTLRSSTPWPAPDEAYSPRVGSGAALQISSSAHRSGGDSCPVGSRCAIHAHLSVFVDGVQRRIPYGIGITDGQVQSTPQGTFVGNGSCFYFLHAHAADGIVHIESPVQRTVTLGNFFDIWGQPLGPNQVGPATGPVTAIYNGKLYDGNPRNIPLNAHAQIQLEVGKPLVAPVTIDFGTL
jgi:hypothetical protein